MGKSTLVGMTRWLDMRKTLLNCEIPAKLTENQDSPTESYCGWVYVLS